jgi:hypothetical protein
VAANDRFSDCSDSRQQIVRTEHEIRSTSGLAKRGVVHSSVAGHFAGSNHGASEGRQCENGSNGEQEHGSEIGFCVQKCACMSRTYTSKRSREHARDNAADLNLNPGVKIFTLGWSCGYVADQWDKVWKKADSVVLWGGP